MQVMNDTHMNHATDHREKILREANKIVRQAHLKLAV